jgi:hypothetical protein
VSIEFLLNPNPKKATAYYGVKVDRPSPGTYHRCP